MISGFRLMVGLAIVLGALAGCGGPPHVSSPLDVGSVEPASPRGTPDQVLLKEALQRRDLTPGEAAALSDRLLGNGNAVLQDQETMARLVLLLLKAVNKHGDKESRPVLLRNLGIIYYHQRKYKDARQQLQNSNELNPRNARTHFYLAKLFIHQGLIYEGQGKKKVAKQQFKRAAIEMDQARKLEPRNTLYHQDIKQIVQQEMGK